MFINYALTVYMIRNKIDSVNVEDMMVRLPETFRRRKNTGAVVDVYESKIALTRKHNMRISHHRMYRTLSVAH